MNGHDPYAYFIDVLTWLPTHQARESRRSGNVRHFFGIAGDLACMKVAAGLDSQCLLDLSLAT